MIPEELVHTDATVPGDGLAESLALKGIKQSPQDIDMAFIKSVYDIGANGFAFNGRNPITMASTSIAGVSNKDIPAIGPKGFSTGGLTPLLETIKQNARVLALHCQVVFDVAGAAAAAGKVIRWQWQLQDAPLAVGCRCLNEYQTVIAARTSYYSLLNGSQSQIVPYDCMLVVNAALEDGTNFPANTTIRVMGQAWLRKNGAALPF